MLCALYYKAVSETSACDAHCCSVDTKDGRTRSENAIQVLHVFLEWKLESQDLQWYDKTQPAVTPRLV